jgi:hypothetical protein
VEASTSKSEVNWSEFIGIWKGTIYQDAMGIFHLSPSIPIDDLRKRTPSTEANVAATVTFLLEVEEKFLSIPGVESCHLTLEHTSNGVQNTTKRDFYRRLPGDNSPGHFTLRGSGGEFDVKRRANGQLEIQGKARHIGDVSIIRQLRATLLTSMFSNIDETRETRACTFAAETKHGSRKR